MGRPHVHDRNYGMIDRHIDARFFDKAYHAKHMPHLHDPDYGNLCGAVFPPTSPNGGGSCVRRFQ
jgi:hypothetical protein